MLLLGLVVEDLLGAVRGELRRQGAGLLAAEFAVVGADHLVAPTVTICDRKSDAVLAEHLLESCSIDRSRIGECSEDRVAESSLEAPFREREPALLPARSRLHRVRQAVQPLVAHQFVVQLVEPMTPGRVPLERLAREIVVVHHEDVGVAVPASRVCMHGNQVVGAVHALGQLHRDVTNAIHVLLRIDVELVGVEGLHVAVQLDLSVVDTGEALGARDELGRRRTAVRHRHREGGCSSCTGFEEQALALPVMPVQDVPHGAGCVGCRDDGDSAHRRVRSPSAARVASKATTTSARSASSMTWDRFSAWLTLIPSRRTCSTAAASAG